MAEAHSRTAVVIGGSAGHGAQIAAALARRSWSVVAADRAAPAPAGIAFEPLDPAESVSVDAAAAAIAARHGTIDGLVIAVDGAAPGTLDDAAWQPVIDAQLGGALRCCRAFGRLLQPGGAVVNVSSLLARRGRSGTAALAAAKAGLEALTRTVAIEWAPRGIRVNAVAPGWIEGVDNADAGILRRIPLGRYGAGDELGAAVAFLLSAEAGYVTGQCLVVDGGAAANGDW